MKKGAMLQIRRQRSKGGGSERQEVRSGEGLDNQTYYNRNS